MTSPVLDASALLALLAEEAGAGTVARALPGAAISAVNLSETIAKLADGGMPEVVIRSALEGLGLDVRPFDAEQAYRAGLLRLVTRPHGLGLGDRACLALAQTLARPALTADAAWSKLKLAVKIQLIR